MWGIFKACDIRGLYPDEINENKVYRIGRAVATICESGRVVVGGDLRLSTESLRKALIDGLISSGSHAVDIGTLSTPAFYFARKHLGIKAGVMITASHNPPDYNGLKIVITDLPITEEVLAQVREVAEFGAFKCAIGSSEQCDILDDYEEHIRTIGRPLLEGAIHQPRVVVDCGNGCCSGTAPRVMRSLGLRCVPIFCEPDGTFPDRQPNTADPANLTALCNHVKRDAAGLGVAFDGDGDRIAFCDETGRVLTADEAVAIIAKYGHGGVGHGDEVVFDVKLSSSVWDVVQSLGAQGIRERSGHTFLKTRMITDNLKLGGEVSGHLFYRELDGGDDGLYSAILMAGIVGRHGPLSTLVEEVPHYALTPDMRLRVESPHQVLESIAEAFPAEMVDRLDGVRVQFEDGWGLARVSVTEPIMTFRFEGKDQLALRECIDRFLSPAPTVMEAVLKMLRRQGVSR